MSDNRDIDTTISQIVDKIFKQKEEAEMKKETEAALVASADKIEELSASLEAKDQELSGILEQVSGLTAKVAEYETKMGELTKSFDDELASYKSEKEDMVKKLEETETALLNIKKDQAASARMVDLKAVGVASRNQDQQFAKVRDMSDEEFAEYKTELVAIREDVLATLANTVDSSADAEASVDVVDDTSSASVDGIVVDDTDEDKALAALNMEVSQKDSILAKYAELGQELAKKSTKKNK